MRRWLKTALIGSFALTLIGMLGITSLLVWKGISFVHFSQNIEWYAGFKDAAPRWPILIEMREGLTGVPVDVRVVECEEIHCPAEKLTEIFRRLLGHLQPITGMPEESSIFDSQGYVTKKYADDRAKANNELLLAANLDPENIRRNLGKFISGVYIDDRAISTLFFLIWTAVLGALGSIMGFVLWMREACYPAVRPERE